MKTITKSIRLSPSEAKELKTGFRTRMYGGSKFIKKNIFTWNAASIA